MGGRTGIHSRQEEVRTGFPWSPAIVARARHAAQGTLMAARIALREGLAANLAGGSHHAFPDHGEGYLNDVAVAIRALQGEGRIRRAAIVDTDAHQGNGTAAAFAGDPAVFTFSIHGARNYPFQKVPGSWDEALLDATGDEAYLARLEGPLCAVVGFAPDIAFYVSGADPYRGGPPGPSRAHPRGPRPPGPPGPLPVPAGGDSSGGDAGGGLRDSPRGDRGDPLHHDSDGGPAAQRSLAESKGV